MRSSDPSSSPFVALTIAHAVGQMRIGQARHIAHAVRRHGDDDELRAIEGDRACRPSAPARLAARCPAGRLDSRATPPCRPQAPRRAPTGARRARCAPGARRAPCPSCPIRSRRCDASCSVRPPNALREGSARSVRDSSRIALPRCRNRINAATMVAPMSTARRPGVIHSTIGSTIVATIDPSDTNRVRATTMAKAAAAIGRRDRRQHAEHAAGGGHALAAAKLQPDRIDVPDHRRRRRRPPRSLLRRRPAPPPRPWPCRRASRRAPSTGPPCDRHWWRRRCRCRRGADRSRPHACATR